MPAGQKSPPTVSHVAPAFVGSAGPRALQRDPTQHHRHCCRGSAPCFQGSIALEVQKLRPRGKVQVADFKSQSALLNLISRTSRRVGKQFGAAGSGQ